MERFPSVRSSFFCSILSAYRVLGVPHHMSTGRSNCLYYHFVSGCSMYAYGVLVSYGVCFCGFFSFDVLRIVRVIHTSTVVWRFQGLGKYLKRNISSVSGRKLPQSTYDAVVKLCEDKANTVFIVSGLNDKGLMHVSVAGENAVLVLRVMTDC